MQFYLHRNSKKSQPRTKSLNRSVACDDTDAGLCLAGAFAVHWIVQGEERGLCSDSYGQFLENCHKFILEVLEVVACWLAIN